MQEKKTGFNRFFKGIGIGERWEIITGERLFRLSSFASLHGY